MTHRPHRRDRDPRVPRPRLAGLLAAAIVAAGAVPMVGCASRDSPSMSGFAFGDTRVVSVGDVVELRVPRRADGSRQWRVSSYDSFYIQLISNPQPVQRADGSWEMLIRARARTAGETEVVVSELLPPGQDARTVRFRLRIRD
jgi:hypothetical protein